MDTKPGGRQHVGRYTRIAVTSVALATLAACSGDGAGTAPVSSPTVTPVPSLPSGALEPGTYVVTIGTAFDATHRITVSVPGGWEGKGGFAVEGPAGMNVGFWNVDNVFADPCRWSGTLLDPPVGPRVDDLVAALANLQGRHASTPTEVTVDGFAGKQIELTVPARINPAGCDGGEFRTWTEQLPVGGVAYHSPGEHDLLWIVDVDGDRLVIAAVFFPETSAQDRAELLQVVESVRID